jgi:signal transduction histidine kinase
MNSGARPVIDALPLHEVPVSREPDEHVLVDRQRIAAHLANTTVRQIFHASMELHSALGRLHGHEQEGAEEHICAAVRELDATLDDLRRAVFDGI